MCIKLTLSSVLLAAVLGLACGDGSPSAPSPVPSTPPPPAAPPVPDVSNLLGVWNLMVRVGDISGMGCVADTMRSQIGLPEPYSLSITQTDKVRVTLRSASGDYACTFTPLVDGDGFTTYGQAGTYDCEQLYLNFRCSDGTQHRIFTYGENIAGHLSGAEMNGTWDADWFEELFTDGVGMKAEFTGTK